MYITDFDKLNDLSFSNGRDLTYVYNDDTRILNLSETVLFRSSRFRRPNAFRYEVESPNDKIYLVNYKDVKARNTGEDATFSKEYVLLDKSYQNLIEISWERFKGNFQRINLYKYKLERASFYARSISTDTLLNILKCQKDNVFFDALTKDIVVFERDIALRFFDTPRGELHYDYHELEGYDLNDVYIIRGEGDSTKILALFLNRDEFMYEMKKKHRFVSIVEYFEQSSMGGVKSLCNLVLSEKHMLRSGKNG